MFDKLAEISLHETENNLEHISIADLIRSSIGIYISAYEEELKNG